MSTHDTALQVLLAQIDASPDRVLTITPELVRSWVQEIIDLRAGLETLRIEHARGREEGCVGWCDCGADEHNAKIDALLAGDT